MMQDEFAGIVLCPYWIDIGARDGEAEAGASQSRAQYGPEFERLYGQILDEIHEEMCDSYAAEARRIIRPFAQHLGRFLDSLFVGERLPADWRSRWHSMVADYMNQGIEVSHEGVCDIENRIERRARRLGKLPLEENYRPIWTDVSSRPVPEPNAIDPHEEHKERIERILDKYFGAETRSPMDVSASEAPGLSDKRVESAAGGALRTTSPTDYLPGPTDDLTPPRDKRRVVPPKPARREEFFNAKLAAAHLHLVEIERVLEALGARIDAARLNQEVEVERDATLIEELIWRYNDALESARDAWLRDNLSGDANTRLLQMLTPASFGLPQFVDQAQADRALRQGMRISERLGQRDRWMNRAVVGMQAVDLAATAAGILLGAGVLLRAFAKATGWVVVKKLALASASIAATIAAELAAESGLRSLGAGEQTIRGARLAAVVIGFILLRRYRGAGYAKGGGNGIAMPPREAPIPPNRGIWGLKPEARWTIAEQRLKKNLPGNFPTIDKFENGVATSIKSLDLKAKTYANPSALWRTVKGYIDKMATFQGQKWAKRVIKATEIQERVLELAIPPDGTEAQRKILQELVAYGAELGVKVRIVEMW